MFKEKIWKVSPRRITDTYTGEEGISPLTMQVLLNRGIKTETQARKFLNPSINDLSEPDTLDNLKDAALLIKKAIKEKKKISIFGDFDADGITSTALLYETLKDLKADVEYYIPCRFKEGYGLNKNAVEKIAKKGCGLLITVDCGITAHEEVAFAKKQGMDVIITDHHQCEAKLPEADFIINPVLSGAENILAGVGVVYQLARILADDNLEEKLELVTLGSIADMVVLKDDNRILAANGLKQINKTKRTGLVELATVSGVELGKIDSYSIGFWLAPRINAGGRLANAYDSLELLLTNDEQKALKIAKRLDKYNRDRQAIEDKIIKEAKEILKTGFNEEDRSIVLSNDGWHEGVKGIVASRIGKEYCRPTFICSEKDGFIKGSGRTFADFNLKKALDGCSDLLENYGGHPAAAGITLSKNNLPIFTERFNELAADFYKDRVLKQTIEIDTIISAEEFNEKTVNEINCLKPYGNGNPEPVFCLHNAYVKNDKLLGEKAIKVLKFDIQAKGKSLPGIAFVDSHRSISQEPVDIAFSMQENTWQGRTDIQAKVLNIRTHEFSLEKPSELVDHLYQTEIESGRYENIAYADSFYTKVAGVSFEGRQEQIAGIQDGEKIVFTREPENPHDPNAVRVDTVSGINLGFLNRELAQKLSPHMDLGIAWEGEVGQVTGGDGKNFGVNILVRKKDKSSFSQFEIQEKVTDPLKIKEALVGGVRLHPKQTEAIESLKKGKNTLLIMGTGRGKSAVFHLHSAFQANLENKITFVLYPLRSLIRDQFLYLEKTMAQIGIKVARLTGESGVEERQTVFKELAGGACHMVLTTPEFLFHNQKNFEGLKERIGFFVVDEAHHLKTASVHHRPVYRLIHKILPKIGNPVVLAATATAGDEVSEEIIKQLNISQIIIDKTVRENLFLEDKRGIEDKEKSISKIIEEDGKTVIYTNSREKCAEIAEKLRTMLPSYKDKIVFYHAGLKPDLRALVQDGFKDGIFTTAVATSAFGEGVNIADIGNIILYHLPFSLVQYNQQCGRAGRDGKKANIHLIYGRRDERLNDFILENVCPGKKNLRLLYGVIKRLTKNNNFIGDNKDILAEYETSGYSGLTERGIGSGLKVFNELGLIEIRKEDVGRVIVLKDKAKAELSDSTLYEEGQREKEIFNEFRELGLNAKVDELLKFFNQPIYPQKPLAKEELLEPV